MPFPRMEPMSSTHAEARLQTLWSPCFDKTHMLQNFVHSKLRHFNMDRPLRFHSTLEASHHLRRPTHACRSENGHVY